uniref:FTH domain-containing protein n=1 Tax=Caenorhabditis tropicalis TaxID=1561998 RepID=A0A1I7TVK4_9PELO
MLVDSLLKLSSKAVAKGLEIDFYKNYDVSLEPPLSDNVFKELTKITQNCSLVIAKKTGLKLNLSSFDHTSFACTEEDLQNLYLHDIRSLVIHLSLKSFKCRFVSDKECQMICRSFPNLTCLEVSCFNMKSLNEIHRLTNLQTLILYCNSFNPWDGSEVLFKLPNLRILEVPVSHNFFKNLSLCHGTFPSLRFIECKRSDINEAQLRQLIAQHPSLEAISVLKTPCERIDFSDLPITVFNMTTFESTMNTLCYKLDERSLDWDRVNELLGRLEELFGNKDVRGFEEDDFLKTMMKVTQKILRLSPRGIQMEKCLVAYFKRFFPDQSMTEILQNLDPKDPLLIERRWAAQTVLRFFPEE